MTDAPVRSTALIPRLLAGRAVWLRILAVVAGALVMGLASQLEFQVGPVPLTLQTLALFVAAGLLGMRMSFQAVLVWLLMAAMGLPVLAGGEGGPVALTGPTGGYLIGMLVAAPLTAGLSERYAPVFLTGIFLLGHLVVLGFGWAWLSGQVGAAEAYRVGVGPFWIGALLKSLAAAAIVWLANSRRPKAASA